MRDVVRYREAFKLRLVEDVTAGKYASLDEAAERAPFSPYGVPSRKSAQASRFTVQASRSRTPSFSPEQGTAPNRDRRPV